jgi:hypothetical protein
LLGTAAPYSQEGFRELRDQVSGALNRSRAGEVILPRIENFFASHELVDGKGDGVVAVKRGKLEGVEDTMLLPVTHWTLSSGDTDAARSELFTAITERLVLCPN